MPRISIPLVASLVCATLLTTLGSPSAAEGEAAPLPCDGFKVVATQGPSCPIPGGWRVQLPDGSTVDTHGPDETYDGRPTHAGGAEKGAAVACVDDPTRQSHNVLVYAFASDRPDRSVQMAPVLRDLVAQANGLLRQESMELGQAGRYKFRCDGANAVTMLVARLPRTDAESTFATIVADLRAMGVNSPYAKHWVWYDGTRENLYGQATMRINDRLTSANGNAKGNDFAVVYGMLDPVALMHENAHNMGAVQLTAPHSSGFGHCTDGLDVLCYRDSPNTPYDATACTDRVHLDCNHDDYFHPNPPAGSYLATHWNLGHRYNRFLDFGRANTPPTVVPITCTPAVVDLDEPTTCRIFVDDDSDGVSSSVSIDGAPAVRHPATGVSIPGHALTLTPSWSTLGEHVLRVTATDDAKKPLTSAPVSVTVRVGCALVRAGNLTGGLGGTPDGTAAAMEEGIPRACSGAPFSLRSMSLGADLDVCWHDALDADLGCFQGLGDESGAIPPGARAAHVFLKAGAAATYELSGW